MKTQSAKASGIEQHFEINETFFSTTDRKGLITAGNKVFSRTSGYTLDELVGSPHNLIRHPGVPRCVFAMLWEHAQQKSPFAGYVKNQAKNGNHYWVFALIEPLTEELLSIRIKPSCGILKSIEPLYHKLVAEEEEAINSGETHQNATLRSKASLEKAVHTFGFPSYQAFSKHCLIQEIKSRDKLISRQGLTLFPSKLEATSETHFIESFEQIQGAYRHLGSVFADLDKFLAMADEIKESRKSVRDIADHFRLNALNANIAATPLGAQGATIETITQFLHTHAGSFSNNAGILAEKANQTTLAVSEIVARLAAARIQMEMLIIFITEMANNDESENQKRHTKMADNLQTAFTISIEQATLAVENVRRILPELGRKKNELLKAIVSFNVAQITGLMECSRLTNSQHLTGMFTDLRQRIESAKSEITKSDKIVNNLTKLAEATPAKISNVMTSLKGISWGSTRSTPENRIQNTRTPCPIKRVLAVSRNALPTRISHRVA